MNWGLVIKGAGWVVMLGWFGAVMVAGLVVGPDSRLFFTLGISWTWTPTMLAFVYDRADRWAARIVAQQVVSRRPVEFG